MRIDDESDGEAVQDRSKAESAMPLTRFDANENVTIAMDAIVSFLTLSLMRLIAR